jgi:SAM-dependent methyltransferase
MGKASTWPCRLCGEPATTLLFEAAGYPIVECPRCELVSTGQVTPRVADGAFYADRYYAQASDYADAQKSAVTTDLAENQERLRTARRYAGIERGRVLDVGCGGGALLATFQRAGWECAGIEPSRDLAASASAVLGGGVHQGMLEEAPFESATFDVITAIHSLEHSLDPIRFLECCHRLLKPRGALLIEVPDFGSRAARRGGAAWAPLYPDVHHYHFTIRSLTRLVTRTGFRVARWRRLGGLGALAAASPASGGAQRVPSTTDRLKRFLFDSRQWLYAIPGAKGTLRYTYWHVLGMNDALAVVALRSG